jgi:hypothetical protein
MRATALALTTLAALTPLSAGADDDTGRVLQRLGVDQPDVRTCLMAEMAASPMRRAEIQRLADVIDWIEKEVTQPRRTGAAPAIAQHKSDTFSDIVATFNHERRLDGARLAALSEGRLKPQHISTWARVQRALGAGHDPKRVLCGL